MGRLPTDYLQYYAAEALLAPIAYYAEILPLSFWNLIIRLPSIWPTDSRFIHESCIIFEQLLPRVDY